MTKRFELMVPQGIGDVFWVYRLFSPLCDELVFHIIDTDPHQSRPVVHRAAPFISALPKVSKVHFYRTSWPDWISERRTTSGVLPALRRGERVGFSANTWLEGGVPLERIDPAHPVDWSVVWPSTPVAGLERNGYLAVYVSGDAARHKNLGEKVWPPEAWARAVDRVCYCGGVGTGLPVVLIGALFDLPVLNTVADDLRLAGFTVRVETGLSPPEVFWFLGNARLFVGYQSGLNAIADAAGARQLMIYFPRIQRMADSWVIPRHRLDGSFRFATFDDTADDVGRRAPW